MPMTRIGESAATCPSCGQQEVVVITHVFGDGTQVGDGHAYCSNCDYGICGLCGLPSEFQIPRSQSHEHQWEDLDKLDGKYRPYMASLCLLCGEVQVD